MVTVASPIAGTTPVSVKAGGYGTAAAPGAGLLPAVQNRPAGCFSAHRPPRLPRPILCPDAARGRRAWRRGGSCVTRMIVLSRPLRSSPSRSRISSADSASRSPVGSSATISVGSVTIARAMPTRCCWPPESWPGRCRMRSARPTSSRAVSTCRRRSAADSGNKQQRQLDVLIRREHRQQVIELEDEADVPRPPAGELAFGHLRDAVVADPDFAFAGLVEAGDQVEQRRLARAAGAHQAEELAFGDFERSGHSARRSARCRGENTCESPRPAR